MTSTTTDATTGTTGTARWREVGAELGPAWLALVRARRPLVQCLTNFVAMDVAANVLLAAGATPAMVHHRREAADMAAAADAVTVNIGTPSPEWVDGFVVAARAARRGGTPWVLDPVAVGATPWRAEVVAELLEQRPTVVRGNAGEVAALAGSGVPGTRGPDVDPASAPADAAGVTVALARSLGAVVACTGERDHVSDGDTSLVVPGGHPLLTTVTATGCALTALVGAFLAVADHAPAELLRLPGDGRADGAGPAPEPHVVATAAALATMAVAGERAGALAAGPGSFRWQLLDALHALSRGEGRVAP